MTPSPVRALVAGRIVLRRVVSVCRVQELHLLYPLSHPARRRTPTVDWS